MSASVPLRSGASNACNVAPSVITRARTPFAPVSVTASIRVPSGSRPKSARVAVAAQAASAAAIVNIPAQAIWNAKPTFMLRLSPFVPGIDPVVLRYIVRQIAGAQGSLW